MLEETFEMSSTREAATPTTISYDPNPVSWRLTHSDSERTALSSRLSNASVNKASATSAK